MGFIEYKEPEHIPIGIALQDIADNETIKVEIRGLGFLFSDKIDFALYNIRLAQEINQYNKATEEKQ